MTQFSSNGHSSDGKPKKRIKIDEMPRGDLSHEDASQQLTSNKGLAMGYTKVPKLMRCFISHQFTEVVSWLNARAVWLVDKKNRLGPEYKGWSYITTKKMLSEFPFLGRGKKTAENKRKAVQYLFKTSLRRWVDTMSGEELASRLGINMPPKWRAYRWYRVKARKIIRAIERVADRRKAKIEAWKQEQNRWKQDAKKVEGTSAIEWARTLRDGLNKLGENPIYNESSWAKSLAKLSAVYGEKDVGLCISCWARYARQARDEGSTDMYKSFRLPNIPDVKRFCRPEVFKWILRRAKEER